VLAGVGNGNMSQSAQEAFAALAKQGTTVVRSSRVGSGWVSRNVEVDDDSFGFVVSQNLNPQKTRILLQLALTQTSDPTTITSITTKIAVSEAHIILRRHGVGYLMSSLAAPRRALLYLAWF